MKLNFCARSAGEEAILEAAIRLFSAHGFDGVSMRTVAREAGVSKSNIYHHFESKEALFLAIWKHSAESLAELVRNLADGVGGFEERVRTFARDHLLKLFDNATTMRLLMREMFFGSVKRKGAMMNEAVGDILENLIDIFENGKRAGLLRPGVDPGVCAHLILGSDTFYLLTDDIRQHPRLQRHSVPHERFSEEMMDIILHGMLVDSAQGSAQA